MKHSVLFILLLLGTTACQGQSIYVYKKESIICNGDTFWKKTIVNRIEQDTIYTYTPDIPTKCLSIVQQDTFLYVERMPEPGYDLDKYFSDSSFIPIIAYCKNSCKVVISFLVDRTGLIKQARISRTECGKVNDSLALILVNKMPSWKPGKQGGKPVPVRYSLAICFSKD